MVMRRSAFVIAFCLCCGPAMASWTLSDLSDEMGVAYAGFVEDGQGIQLELYCDDWLPGMVDMTIHTGQSTSEIADAIPVRAAVSVDGIQGDTIDMFVDDLDGKVVIYTSNLDADNFEDVMVMIARATESVALSGSDWAYTFSTDGAFDVIRELANVCPT
jgi:hypothetical protein